MKLNGNFPPLINFYNTLSNNWKIVLNSCRVLTNRIRKSFGAMRKKVVKFFVILMYIMNKLANCLDCLLLENNPSVNYVLHYQNVKFQLFWKREHSNGKFKYQNGNSICLNNSHFLCERPKWESNFNYKFLS